jgi:hypothetical protein
MWRKVQNQWGGYVIRAVLLRLAGACSRAKRMRHGQALTATCSLSEFRIVVHSQQLKLEPPLKHVHMIFSRGHTYSWRNRHPRRTIAHEAPKSSQCPGIARGGTLIPSTFSISLACRPRLLSDLYSEVRSCGQIERDTYPAVKMLSVSPPFLDHLAKECTDIASSEL